MNDLLTRTFPSKICNNKEELLKICHELSEEVSKELENDGLKVLNLILLNKVRLQHYLVFMNIDVLHANFKV